MDNGNLPENEKQIFDEMFLIANRMSKAANKEKNPLSREKVLDRYFEEYKEKQYHKSA